MMYTNICTCVYALQHIYTAVKQQFDPSSCSLMHSAYPLRDIARLATAMHNNDQAASVQPAAQQANKLPKSVASSTGGTKEVSFASHGSIKASWRGRGALRGAARLGDALTGGDEDSRGGRGNGVRLCVRPARRRDEAGGWLSLLTPCKVNEEFQGAPLLRWVFPQLQGQE
jgi:hypothetical protein